MRNKNRAVFALWIVLNWFSEIADPALQGHAQFQCGGYAIRDKQKEETEPRLSG